jgi:predicted nucleotidyltransferase
VFSTAGGPFKSTFKFRNLSLFGSVIRDDFKQGSGIDILIEFKPGTRMGLIGLTALEFGSVKLSA